MLSKLERDIALGAKGLKLHPIIQNVPLDDERTIEACRLFGERRLPITTHCGVNDYYKPDSPHLKKTNLNYGHIDHILRWLERFPDYILVPAHGGGCCGGEMEIMAEAVRAHGWKNVYTDTSHRGVEYILKAVEFFGEDRVLYATDWPFDTCTCNVKCHIEALGDNPDLLDRVFYRNSAQLLGMPV